MKKSKLLSGREWEAPLHFTEKGVPGNVTGLPLSQVADMNWNVLAEDLPMPAAVIRRDALLHNSAWMRAFLQETGVQIAPHGKTTMSPTLFDLQLADGAWAITIATPHQFQVARRFGYKRIFMANQLLGRRAIADTVDALVEDQELDFYCLVDDPSNVAALAAGVRARGLNRPLKVLVELGYHGGRTGCRDTGRALEVARAVHGERDALALSGVEGFEGLIRGDGTAEARAQVDCLLDGLVSLAEAVEKERFFASGLVLLSAGGSSYFDIVSKRLSDAQLNRPFKVLLRSGCYITYDSGLYVRAMQAMGERKSAPSGAQEGLRAALEVWAYVQSRPEPGKAIIAFGKRDASHDEPPMPLKWFRPNGNEAGPPLDIPEGHTVTRLNDQHCHMEIPESSPLAVGDLVGFGISHPCLTFDKWRVMHLVDETYRVTGSFRTYF